MKIWLDTKTTEYYAHYYNGWYRVYDEDNYSYDKFLIEYNKNIGRTEFGLIETVFNKNTGSVVNLYTLLKSNCGYICSFKIVDEYDIENVCC